MAVTTSKIVSGYEDPERPGEPGPVVDLSEIAGLISPVVYIGVTRDVSYARISTALTALFASARPFSLATDDHVVSARVVSVSSYPGVSLPVGRVWPEGAAAPFLWVLTPSITNFVNHYSYQAFTDRSNRGPTRRFTKEGSWIRINGVAYDLSHSQLQVPRHTTGNLSIACRYSNPMTSMIEQIT